MTNRLIRKFIASIARRSISCNMINSENQMNAKRFMPLFIDEHWNDHHGLLNARPRYLPFNIFLHCWRRGDVGLMHDHPRWSITIVLKGALKEQTPKKDKWLTPGSIVIRSASFIHRIVVPPKHQGTTWTLFIVGRRLYRQHYFDDDGNPKNRYEDAEAIKQ